MTSNENRSRIQQPIFYYVHHLFMMLLRISIQEEMFEESPIDSSLQYFMFKLCKNEIIVVLYNYDEIGTHPKIIKLSIFSFIFSFSVPLENQVSWLEIPFYGLLIKIIFPFLLMHYQFQTRIILLHFYQFIHPPDQIISLCFILDQFEHK